LLPQATKEVANRNCLAMMQEIATKYASGQIKKVDMKPLKRKLLQECKVRGKTTGPKKKPAAALGAMAKARPRCESQEQKQVEKVQKQKQVEKVQEQEQVEKVHGAASPKKR
jgi:hypothetical protein